MFARVDKSYIEDARDPVNVTDSVIRSNEQRTADPLELSSLAQQEEQKD